MSNEGTNNQIPTKFLYGAAVQGIQGFIFQTNTLAEIVGASELVEDICTNLFDDVLQNCDIKKGESNAIVNAAGNIKYIFDNKDDCAKVVRIFPKTVTEYAPGINISQSVVEYTPYIKGKGGQEIGFTDAVQELERRIRIQRNKLMRDTMVGLMGIERSRQTGLPVTHITKKGEHVDEGTYLKLYTDVKNEKGETYKTERKNTTQELCRKAFINPQTENKEDVKVGQIPFDIKEMTEKNDWIAIIHADGNGLGQVVQKIGTQPEVFKKFSKKLDEATTAAAVQAFESVVNVDLLKKGEKIPMRPIVLSGDDHTVICRADLAIPYTEAFIENFEKSTEEKLGKILSENNVFKSGENYLTACAGIAFIKSSYPFYYGYQLAEALCDRAKKDTKALYKANEGNLPASCLMFHKVQDSFITSYDDIVKRELAPQTDISFEFGPYYIYRNVENKIENRWTVENLVKKSIELNTESMRPVKAGLRNWLSLIHINPEMAAQRLERLKTISGKDKYIEYVTTPCKKVTTSQENNRFVYPVYDILAVNSIDTQNTKKKDEKTK